LALSTLAGCGIGTIAAPSPTVIPAISGVVHGGATPIVGATITLYVTSNSATAYGSGATSIGTATTSSTGSFTVSPTATAALCPAGSQAYLTSAGGYEGSVTTALNTNVLLVAALGDCANLIPAANVHIVINEATTVAAAYALSGFSTTTAGTSNNSYDGNSTVPTANIGAPVMNNSAVGSITPTAPAGLAHAFLNSAALVPYATGYPNFTTNTATYSGNLNTTITGTISTTLLNTLADIMQACVDTVSTPSSLSTSCNTLFTNTKSLGGNTPTNTFQAMVNLARNPYPGAAAMTALYGLIAGSGDAFLPYLPAAPNDWSIAIYYTTGATPAPYWLALDQNDTVFLGRSTLSASSSALFAVNAYGGTLPSSFAAPSTIASSPTSRGIAPDALGNVWIAENDYTVDRYSASAGTLSGTYTSPTNSSYGLAVDKQNNLWISHVTSGATSVTAEEVANTSTTPSTSGTWSTTTPSLTVESGANTGGYGITVDASQNVWMAGYYNSGTMGLLFPNLNSVSSPSYTSSGTAISAVTATVGSKPYSVAIDASGAAWFAITGSNSATTTGVVKATANAATGATSFTVGSLITSGEAASQMIAIDGAGTLFIPDNNGSTTQGVHMYQTVSATTLTPSTGLRSAADSVGSLSFTTNGVGCTTAPTLAFSGGGGSGAVASTIITTTPAAGAVSTYALTNGGTGYTSAPTITVTNSGTNGCTTQPALTATLSVVYNPRQIAVDSTGSIWAGFTIGGVTQIIGVAAPSYPLLSIGKPGLSPGLTAVNPLP
jgi:hypothetical protein